MKPNAVANGKGRKPPMWSQNIFHTVTGTFAFSGSRCCLSKCCSSKRSSCQSCCGRDITARPPWPEASPTSVIGFGLTSLGISSCKSFSIKSLTVSDSRTSLASPSAASISSFLAACVRKASLIFLASFLYSMPAGWSMDSQAKFRSYSPPKASFITVFAWRASAMEPLKAMVPPCMTTKRSAVGAKRSKSCELMVTMRVQPFIKRTTVVSQTRFNMSLSTCVTGSSSKTVCAAPANTW
mmetsp:Transcript_28441/g.65761  ORF Transcript_28441/g.65761 Transcript_28441/m.65761 type:complete len:239 (-) Transcript_28441:1679-2395(-)